MSLLRDPSLALGWCFEDQRAPAADALLNLVADEGATVPALWRIEIANGFRNAIRRRHINSAFRDKAIAQLMHLPITVDPDTDRFGLTLYDAAYLELAQRCTLPLATLDEVLRAGARGLGVSLLGLAPDT